MITVDRSGCSAAVHGTYWAYGKFGCRCFDARVDESRYRADYRSGIRRFVDATAARRITQGLACHGYTAGQIAELAGICRRTVCHLQSGRKTTLAQATDIALRVLAVRVRLDEPRTGRVANVARGAALRNGWVPLAAWDDDTIDDPDACPLSDNVDDRTVVDPVAIERALEGERVRLNRLERHHAIHAGLARGVSRPDLSKALRISWSEITRLENTPLPGDSDSVAA